MFEQENNRATKNKARKIQGRWLPIAVAAVLGILAIGLAGFTLYKSTPLNVSANIRQAAMNLALATSQPTSIPSAQPQPSATAKPASVAPKSTAAPLAVSKQVAAVEGLVEQTAGSADVSCPKPAGQIVTSTINSKITAAPITVHTYLPPCYDAREYTYPTLYLIHGTAFEQGGWIYDGVPRVADIQMSVGSLPPFIIVMPGADMRAGEASKYAWSNWGEQSYEGFVMDELIPFVDKKYSTWASREGRAIGGISRGGYWAIQIAFANPDKFSVVGGHSPSVDKLLVGMPANFSMLDTARSMGALHTLRIWLDAGSDDWARFDAKKLADELDAESISYSMDVGPGNHEDSYWTSRVPDYLAFYASNWPREARTRQAAAAVTKSQ